mgnify:CR=1 FL=1
MCSYAHSITLTRMLTWQLRICRKDLKTQNKNNNYKKKNTWTLQNNIVINNNNNNTNNNNKNNNTKTHTNIPKNRGKNNKITTQLSIVYAAVYEYLRITFDTRTQAQRRIQNHQMLYDWLLLFSFSDFTQLPYLQTKVKWEKALKHLNSRLTFDISAWLDVVHIEDIWLISMEDRFLFLECL